MKCNMYPVFRPFVKGLFFMLFRPKIINKELIPKEGPIVLAGNHRHALDPISIGVCTKRTIHFLAKKELYKFPFNFFFNIVGTLPVDKHNKNNNTINLAEEELKRGGTIGIFPEGTRNRTKNKLLPFKKGAVNFAYNTDSLIVPFATTGDYRIFGKRLTIIVGEPYKVKTDDMEKEAEILREKVLSLIESCE